MPRPAVKAMENQIIEILTPVRTACRETVICDCCRERKSTSDFDLDGCGICINCIECDELLIDIGAEVQSTGYATDMDSK